VDVDLPPYAEGRAEHYVCPCNGSTWIRIGSTERWVLVDPLLMKLAIDELEELTIKGMR
jgi:hypothetical protein